MPQLRLYEAVQSNVIGTHLGVEQSSGRDSGRTLAAVQRGIAQDLERVRATNDRYFRMYWVLLSVSFIATFVLAVHFREEMGGIAGVLGAGGIGQGYFARQLSREWREKSRVDLVSVLAQTLPAAELQKILKDLLSVLKN